jgi:hypothetical protein
LEFSASLQCQYFAAPSLCAGSELVVGAAMQRFVNDL